MSKVEEIEGVGPAYAEKLAAAGIKSIEDLLEHCGAEKLILKWTNHADLIRIKGVGPEYAELLEAAGVDTVKELKHRNAENLAAKMKEVSEATKITRQTPSASQVADWIEQAKGLEAKISH